MANVFVKQAEECLLKYIYLNKDSIRRFKLTSTIFKGLIWKKNKDFCRHFIIIIIIIIIIITIIIIIIISFKTQQIDLVKDKVRYELPLFKLEIWNILFYITTECEITP